jgi:DNA-directed RNA polymerase specialized sigma24 family protein
MTSTSPELSPSTAERLRHVDIPAAAARLPELNAKYGENGEDKQNNENNQAQPDQQSTFDRQFSHCGELLHFIARRILHCVQDAEEAVKNCRLTASRNPPGFSSEGAFKSWLVRILIDEATLLLRTKHSNSASSQPEQVREQTSEPLPHRG